MQVVHPVVIHRIRDCVQSTPTTLTHFTSFGGYDFAVGGQVCLTILYIYLRVVLKSWNLSIAFEAGVKVDFSALMRHISKTKISPELKGSRGSR